MTLVGRISVIDGPGAGVVTMNVVEFDAPAVHPELSGFTTRTDRERAVASTPGGTVTIRLDGLTEEGVSVVPPQSTEELEQKLAPEIVTTRAPLPAGTFGGFNPLIEGPEGA
jgi:hypothetical protein